MKVSSFLGSIALFSSSAFYANAATPETACWYACEAALYHLTWSGGFDECSVPAYYKSNIYCAAYYCTPAEVQAGWKDSNTYCISEGSPIPSPESIVTPSFDFASLPLINLSTVYSTDAVDHPVLIDANVFAIGKMTVAAFDENISLSHDFIWSLYGFWAFVVIVGISWRLLELFKIRRRSPTFSTRQFVVTRSWLWIRNNLVLPAAVGQHSQEPIAGFTVPPRLESVPLGLYIILNFVYCFPSYNIFLPNLYYSQTRLQLIRYVADRTGILSIGNVPILWLFASRNSILQPLAGWSFAMFNRFHRWVARIATAQAIVHSICYTVFDFYSGGSAYYYLDWKSQYWYCGEIATIVMSLILISSVFLLRRSFYDFFLVLHIVFAVIFVVALYYHIEIFDKEYKGFIWVCVAIWSLDRLLRIVRIASTGILPRFLKGSKALATYDNHAEILRLDVTDLLRNKPFHPGHFYYIYVPAQLRGWESHPFTLCSWRQGRPVSRRSSSNPSISEKKNDLQKDNNIGVRMTAASGYEDGIRHSFLIRPYDGFTGRLRDRFSSSVEAQHSGEITVLLEGPYGEGVDLNHFSNVLIIAGGSGIAIAVTHAHKLLQAGKTKVQIVWATKHRSLVDDICKHELRAVIDDDLVDLIVHLTGPAVTEETVEPPGPQPYEWHFGRPDLYVTMAHARRSCSKDLAVVTCGTPRMLDACRQAVVDCLHEDGPDLQYYNETMLW